jgi:hypothetical protein
MTFTTFPVFQRARSLFLRFQTLRITSGDVAPQPLRDRVCGCSRNRRIADAFVDAPWCSEGNLHTTNDLGNLVVDVRHSIIYGKYPYCNSMRHPQIFRNDHPSFLLCQLVELFQSCGSCQSASSHTEHRSATGDTLMKISLTRPRLLYSLVAIPRLVRTKNIDHRLLNKLESRPRRALPGRRGPRAQGASHRIT